MTLAVLRLRRGVLPLLAVLLALLVFLALAESVHADGIIIPRPPPDRPTLAWRDIPLSIKYHHVEVTIKDQVATTRVDQVFVNDAAFTVEGTYMFPLPEDAAISSFDMTVDGQKYEGKLLGREQARAIYEDIVRTQRDPALLEYVGRGAFQASIFPIPPRAERRIELTYSQVLQQRDGMVRYLYPLNTERFSARPLQNVAVNVRLEDKEPLRAIYSPSHPVQIVREGDRRASIAYQANNLRPDRDFDLYYSLSPDAIAVNLLSYKASGEDGFFLLLVTPPIQAGGTVVAKDVVLVLDTSGSMDGDKIEQARAAANYVLDHLNAGDRFNIVGFNTFVKLYASEPRPVTERENGRAFIREMETAGSTDINRALLEAVAGADPSRPTIVIFLTDGLPTAGEIDPDRIVANVTGAAPKSVRLFTFGVGYDVDTMLLDQLSANLRGVSAYVKPEQTIDEEVSGFYARVSTPVLVDVAARFTGVTAEDLYPYPLPDLFAGQQLVVAGRYRQGGAASLDLAGEVNNKPQGYSYRDLRFVDRGGNEFIPRLWAQRKIGYLLTQIRLHGPKDELVKEVIALSTRYGIVTPYTSFLVQEPPQGAVQQPAARPTAVPGVAPAPRAAATTIVEKPVEKVVEKGAPGAATKAPAAAAPAPAAPAPAPLPALQERSGEKAVERAVAEQELSAGEYAAGPAASDQVRQIGDKAFVLRGGAWTDTSFDPGKMKAETIAFGSDRYFQFLAEHPDVGPYLALGDRATLVLDGQAYSIGSSEQTSAPATSPPVVARAEATSMPGLTPDKPSTLPAPAACPGAAGAMLLVLLGLILPIRMRRR